MGEEALTIKGIIMILIAVFSICLVIVAMQGLLAGDWTNVGQNIAGLIVFITVFAIVIGAIGYWSR